MPLDTPGMKAEAIDLSIAAAGTLFFWQRAPRHCERAYLSEVERRQFPDANAANI